MTATFFTDLSHNALITATGDDAAAFLHGQFTNEVAGLPDGAAQWNGWCTAKGRLVASFLLVRRGESFLLMLPAEVAPSFLKRLSMYVLRAKVKLALDTDRGAIGLAGKGASAIVRALFGGEPEPMRVVSTTGDPFAVRLDTQRYVLFGAREHANALRSALLEQRAQAADAEAWEGSSIRAGIPTIVAATQEAFIPQMVNFDLIGAVSFHKGCYPGQEIVARTQYRGILKRRMALAHCDAPQCPQPGDSVYSAAFGEQAAGTVVNGARSPEGGCDLLVVAQLESIDQGDLRWKSPDGPPIAILSRPHAPATELAS